MRFDRFRQLARPGALVPVWADMLLDTDTPVSAFAKLRRGPFAFLLESAPAGGETWARYTYLGTEPRAGTRLQQRVDRPESPEREHGAEVTTGREPRVRDDPDRWSHPRRTVRSRHPNVTVTGGEAGAGDVGA